MCAVFFSGTELLMTRNAVGFHALRSHPLISPHFVGTKTWGGGLRVVDMSLFVMRLDFFHRILLGETRSTTSPCSSVDRPCQAKAVDLPLLPMDRCPMKHRYLVTGHVSKCSASGWLLSRQQSAVIGFLVVVVDTSPLAGNAGYGGSRVSHRYACLGFVTFFPSLLPHRS